eukprot:6208585-Pleurochrysis_carterae.AAC.4
MAVACACASVRVSIRVPVHAWGVRNRRERDMKSCIESIWQTKGPDGDGGRSEKIWHGRAANRLSNTATLCRLPCVRTVSTECPLCSRTTSLKPLCAPVALRAVTRELIAHTRDASALSGASPEPRRAWPSRGAPALTSPGHIMQRSRPRMRTLSTNSEGSEKGLSCQINHTKSGP